MLALVVVLFVNAKNSPQEVKKAATEQKASDCSKCPSATAAACGTTAETKKADTKTCDPAKCKEAGCDPAKCKTAGVDMKNCDPAKCTAMAKK